MPSIILLIKSACSLIYCANRMIFGIKADTYKLKVNRDDCQKDSKRAFTYINPISTQLHFLKNK